MTGIVVLISGRGSNMRSLVEQGLPVRAVLSNRPDAAGLAFARERGLPAITVDHRAYPSRESFDDALIQTIDRFDPRCVVLAGFMRILTEGFVRHYDGRLLNIHPSLLPSFTGLDTHARALRAGVKLHGATVHLVTSELDIGPIILQAAIPMLRDESASQLADRILAQEHRILPIAVRWLLDGRIDVTDGIVRVAGNPPQWMFDAG
ncbi:MAG: phosphoribosylglycinamide formyltransferase [Burkholderiales bacterium]